MNEWGGAVKKVGIKANELLKKRKKIARQVLAGGKAGIISGVKSANIKNKSAVLMNK